MDDGLIAIELTYSTVVLKLPIRSRRIVFIWIVFRKLKVFCSVGNN